MIKYPFTKDSAADRFCRIANVDWSVGYSELVNINVLNDNSLSMGNGGSWCRSDGPLGKIFNITRIKEKGTIVAVKLDGFNKNHKAQIISTEIRNHFKGDKCVVLYINSGFIEIDHKDGRKDNLSVDINQNIEDFQPIHKTVNVAKRDHCGKCIESGVRFDATVLGFKYPQWIGPEEYSGSCVGCYWFDPFVFNGMISEQYEKDK